MCTVTFIPTNEGFYFTSSRDEKASRATIPPTTYQFGGIELVFPKDEQAGGTWIASNQFGKTVCLLNGAFINHQKAKQYDKSRGLILLESFNFETANEFCAKIELNNIEPFTLLTLDYQAGKLNSFYEFRWDGNKKYLKKLPHSENQIWSSATLYAPSVQETRQFLFNSWINKFQGFEDKEILNFHNRKHGLNINEDILMQGQGDLRTLSISQIHIQQNNATFNYFDIENNKDYKVELHKNSLVNA
jgi:hypothetical protein